MKLLDYILITIILVCCAYITYFYVVSEINTCTADPLTYTSNKFIEDYGNQLEGTLYFQDAKNYTFKLIFNSTGYTIEDPNYIEVNYMDYHKPVNLTGLNNLFVKNYS